MLSPKRILAPLDFSEDSLEALDAAREIASRNNSELLLVHAAPVIPKLPSDVSILHEGDYERELIHSAEKRIEELAEKTRRVGLRTRTAVSLANDAAMEILRTAEAEDVDLIVIATHGMTGWRRLAFGSVTDKVVRLAECPVLVLRKRAAQQPAARTAAAKA